MDRDLFRFVPSFVEKLIESTNFVLMKTNRMMLIKSLNFFILTLTRLDNLIELRAISENYPRITAFIAWRSAKQ
jgi:hypothetical protein